MALYGFDLKTTQEIPVGWREIPCFSARVEGLFKKYRIKAIKGMPEKVDISMYEYYKKAGFNPVYAGFSSDKELSRYDILRQRMFENNLRVPVGSLPKRFWNSVKLPVRIPLSLQGGVHG